MNLNKPGDGRLLNSSPGCMCFLDTLIYIYLFLPYIYFLCSHVIVVDSSKFFCQRSIVQLKNAILLMICIFFLFQVSVEYYSLVPTNKGKIIIFYIKINFQ